MRVAVTGTPGTGKTTATDLVETHLEVVHLNRVVEEQGLTAGVDEARGSWIVDEAAVADWLDGREDLLVESHLAHRFAADRVVVLRCRPDVLADRLEDRGATPAKAEENAEAEALDLVLVEAIERHGTGSVYEVDTTDRPPDAVAADIEAVVEGAVEPSAGTVTFIEYVEGVEPT